MRLLYLVLFLFPCLTTDAQKRYLYPVFADIKITESVVYGQNFTIMPLLQVPSQGHTLRESLRMDVYEPQGDTASARPLVVLVHDGFLLPQQFTGNCSGTRKDGEIVALAHQLAERGFVVAAIDYRLGWNPFLSTEWLRRFMFVNAIYRGVQDSRTCIRFFKKDFMQTNIYRIDPGKVILWGVGMGGTITLASATLDSMNDWDKEKFRMPDGMLMISDTINGNLDATNFCYDYPLPGLGFMDTLCIPNHEGYSGKSAIGVNMGGFLLDIAWLQANDIPQISFAAPASFFPFECSDFYLWMQYSPEYLPLLNEVAGSCAVQDQQFSLGNSSMWLNAGFTDPLTQHSLLINGGTEGFYPFAGTTDQAPWQYTITPVWPDTNCIDHAAAASLYIDTILQYFAPRACAVLGLEPSCNAVSNNKPEGRTRCSVSVSPNPAVNAVRIAANDDIQSVEIYDMQGRFIQRHDGLNTNNLEIQCPTLPDGVYLLKVRLVHGFGVATVILQ